jgi:hypothetical protein
MIARLTPSKCKKHGFVGAKSWNRMTKPQMLRILETARDTRGFVLPKGYQNYKRDMICVLMNSLAGVRDGGLIKDFSLRTARKVDPDAKPRERTPRMQFISEYFAAHKGKAAATELMKAANAAWKKSPLYSPPAASPSKSKAKSKAKPKAKTGAAGVFAPSSPTKKRKDSTSRAKASSPRKRSKATTAKKQTGKGFNFKQGGPSDFAALGIDDAAEAMEDKAMEDDEGVAFDLIDM